MKPFILFLILLTAAAGCSQSSAPNKNREALDLSWEEIEKEADGTTVRMFMWGGDEELISTLTTGLRQDLKSNMD